MSSPARALRPTAFAAWLSLWLLAAALARSMGSRWHVAHVWPQPAAVGCAMFAVYFPLTASLPLALLLGLDAGQSAGAPLGLVELSYVWATAAVATVRGPWLGSDRRALAAGTFLWHVACQLLLAIALFVAHRRVGFASVPEALGVVGAVLDAALAMAAWPLLQALAQRLSPMPPATLARHVR